MARGWESKSVEAQVEDKNREKEVKPLQERADDSSRARKRESIEMSRRRVATELETATTEVHRTALKNALDFLDEQLASLAGRVH